MAGNNQLNRKTDTITEVKYKVTPVKWPLLFVGFLYKYPYQRLNLLIMIEIKNFSLLINLDLAEMKTFNINQKLSLNKTVTMKKIFLFLVSGIMLIPFHEAFSQTASVDNAKLDSAIKVADRIIETDPRIFFKNVESIIVFSDGKLKFEKYYNGYNGDSLHLIQSQTKSIVALLMGIAIDKGFVENENVQVASYFPEYFSNGDKLKSRVTIRDLLTMTAGFAWEEMIPFENPENDNAKMYRSGNWLQYSLSRPMATEPFREFKYNSGCPMIVAGIIEKATKMRLDEFADKYLFGPLSINNYSWLEDPAGFFHAGGGLRMLPADVVKIGILVLNNGKWASRQVVSEGWIRKMIRPYISTSMDSSEYGYFWWIRDLPKRENKSIMVASAEGAGGQKLYVFPDYRLVIAFTERNYTTPQVSPLFIKESVLPVLD